MLEERVSVLSQGPVRFPVAADSAGALVNPTTATGQVAWLQSNANPIGGDWHNAAWDVTVIGSYVLEANPGPSGAALAAGTYYAWVKIVDPGSGLSVIKQVGELIVE